MKKIILALLGATLLWSCSESLLDKESTAEISAEKAFSNGKTIEAVRVGMYAELAYKGAGAFYTMKLPVLSDILGNDMVYGATWYQTYNDVYSYKAIPRSAAPSQVWQSLYYATEITNTVLTKLTDDSYKVVRAEAKAIRGMIHVDAARFFGKAYHLDNGASKALPYITGIEYDPAKPGDIRKPFRNTMKEIYELAIKDLTESLVDLPELQGNVSIMNKNAVHAILSRIYLDMHDYEKAKMHAEEALKGTELMTAEEYYNGDLSRVNNESILCFKSNKNKYSKWRTITSFFDNWDGMGDDYLVNSSLFQLFAKTDLRRKFFVVEIYPSNNSYRYEYWKDYKTKPELGLLLAQNLSPKGYYAYGKMPRKDSNLENKVRGTLGLGDYNYIRASEMVLVVAECEARLGNTANAQDQLYKIQHRADETVVKSTKTGEELIDEILVERRKELFGEGHSLRDILRLGKGLHRDGSQPTKVDLEAGDPRFQWPLPNYATDRNPNLLK